MKKRIPRYAIPIEPWYPCEQCDRIATWRINTTGIDGEGFDLCRKHCIELLQRPENKDLLEQAEQRGFYQ
jgi:DNA polymerase III alpha subunit (gram-positive type)